MDYGGLNLKQLKSKGFNFDQSIISLILRQALNGLRDIHGIGIVHRDIKPENLVLRPVDTMDKFNIFIIDYGLSKSMQNQDGSLLSEKRVGGIAGTINYLDPRVYRGWNYCQGTDLVSLCYSIVFLASSLPWSKAKKANYKNRKQHHQMVQKIKMETTIESLCSGIEIENFEKFCEKSYNLKFGEIPPYQQYITWFENGKKQTNTKNEKILNESEINGVKKDKTLIKQVDVLKQDLIKMKNENQQLKQENNLLSLRLKHSKADAEKWKKNAQKNSKMLKYAMPNYAIGNFKRTTM